MANPSCTNRSKSVSRLAPIMMLIASLRNSFRGGHFQDSRQGASGHKVLRERSARRRSSVNMEWKILSSRTSFCRPPTERGDCPSLAARPEARAVLLKSSNELLTHFFFLQRLVLPEGSRPHCPCARWLNGKPVLKPKSCGHPG